MVGRNEGLVAEDGRVKPERVEPDVHFLGEQSGPAEMDLIANLIPVLRAEQDVRMAYLAQVRYGSSGSTDVAVCIALKTGREDPGLVASVGNVFAAMFGPQEHLDVLFVDEEREEAVRSVCRPFYSQ